MKKKSVANGYSTPVKGLSIPVPGSEASSVVKGSLLLLLLVMLAESGLMEL
jgi:hypothetical protein